MKLVVLEPASYVWVTHWFRQFKWRHLDVAACQCARSCGRELRHMISTHSYFRSNRVQWHWFTTPTFHFSRDDYYIIDKPEQVIILLLGTGHKWCRSYMYITLKIGISAMCMQFSAPGGRIHSQGNSNQNIIHLGRDRQFMARRPHAARHRVICGPQKQSW